MPSDPKWLFCFWEFLKNAAPQPENTISAACICA
jgi:hypothetical protein